ncbi:hypothetical protein SNEBB_003026 [Seison nebaliae]|nr:hypothetical protein SNEBB_003026 [Seison nebaliae]
MFYASDNNSPPVVAASSSNNGKLKDITPTLSTSENKPRYIELDAVNYESNLDDDDDDDDDDGEEDNIWMDNEPFPTSSTYHGFGDNLTRTFSTDHLTNQMVKKKVDSSILLKRASVSTAQTHQISRPTNDEKKKKNVEGRKKGKRKGTNFFQILKERVSRQTRNRIDQKNEEEKGRKGKNASPKIEKRKMDEKPVRESSSTHHHDNDIPTILPTKIELNKFYEDHKQYLKPIAFNNNNGNNFHNSDNDSSNFFNYKTFSDDLSLKSIFLTDMNIFLKSFINSFRTDNFTVISNKHHVNCQITVSYSNYVCIETKNENDFYFYLPITSIYQLHDSLFLPISNIGSKSSPLLTTSSSSLIRRFHILLKTNDTQLIISTTTKLFYDDLWNRLRDQSFNYVENVLYNNGVIHQRRMLCQIAFQVLNRYLNCLEDKLSNSPSDDSPTFTYDPIYSLLLRSRFSIELDIDQIVNMSSHHHHHHQQQQHPQIDSSLIQPFHSQSYASSMLPSTFAQNTSAVTNRKLTSNSVYSDFRPQKSMKIKPNRTKLFGMKKKKLNQRTRCSSQKNIEHNKMTKSKLSNIHQSIRNNSFMQKSDNLEIEYFKTQNVCNSFSDLSSIQDPDLLYSTQDTHNLNNTYHFPVDDEQKYRRPYRNSSSSNLSEYHLPNDQFDDVSYYASIELNDVTLNCEKCIIDEIFQLFQSFISISDHYRSFHSKDGKEKRFNLLFRILKKLLNEIQVLERIFHPSSLFYENRVRKNHVQLARTYGMRLWQFDNRTKSIKNHSYINQQDFNMNNSFCIFKEKFYFNDFPLNVKSMDLLVNECNGKKRSSKYQLTFDRKEIISQIESSFNISRYSLSDINRLYDTFRLLIGFFDIKLVSLSEKRSHPISGMFQLIDESSLSMELEDRLNRIRTFAKMFNHFFNGMTQICICSNNRTNRMKSSLINSSQNSISNRLLFLNDYIEPDRMLNTELHTLRIFEGNTDRKSDKRIDRSKDSMEVFHQSTTATIAPGNVRENDYKDCSVILSNNESNSRQSFQSYSLMPYCSCIINSIMYPIINETSTTHQPKPTSLPTDYRQIKEESHYNSMTNNDRLVATNTLQTKPFTTSALVTNKKVNIPTASLPEVDHPMVDIEKFNWKKKIQQFFSDKLKLYVIPATSHTSSMLDDHFRSTTKLHPHTHSNDQNKGERDNSSKDYHPDEFKNSRKLSLFSSTNRIDISEFNRLKPAKSKSNQTITDIHYSTKIPSVRRSLNDSKRQVNSELKEIHREKRSVIDQKQEMISDKKNEENDEGHLPKIEMKLSTRLTKTLKYPLHPRLKEINSIQFIASTEVRSLLYRRTVGVTLDIVFYLKNIYRLMHSQLQASQDENHSKKNEELVKYLKNINLFRWELPNDHLQKEHLLYHLYLQHLLKNGQLVKMETLRDYFNLVNIEKEPVDLKKLLYLHLQAVNGYFSTKVSYFLVTELNGRYHLYDNYLLIFSHNKIFENVILLLFYHHINNTVELLFRQNAAEIILLGRFLMHAGKNFLCSILNDMILDVIKYSEKINEDDLVENKSKKIYDSVRTVIRNIFHYVDMIPRSVKYIFNKIYDFISAKFPNTNLHLRYRALSHLLFFRFICLALYDPKKFCVIPTSTRITSLSDDILKNVANHLKKGFARLEQKDNQLSVCSPMDSLFYEHYKSIMHFYHYITHVNESSSKIHYGSSKKSLRVNSLMKNDSFSDLPVFMKNLSKPSLPPPPIPERQYLNRLRVTQSSTSQPPSPRRLTKKFELFRKYHSTMTLSTRYVPPIPSRRPLANEQKETKPKSLMKILNVKLPFYTNNHYGNPTTITNQTEFNERNYQMDLVIRNSFAYIHSIYVNQPQLIVNLLMELIHDYHTLLFHNHGKSENSSKTPLHHSKLFNESNDEVLVLLIIFTHDMLKYSFSLSLTYNRCEHELMTRFILRNNSTNSKSHGHKKNNIRTHPHPNMKLRTNSTIIFSRKKFTE